MEAMPPPSELSKNQIDRLGDRLREGDISEDDLRLLDSYRRSFGDGYEGVVSQIRDRLNLEPTGRPAKSTTSIIDKLQRESIRLSQMQDIAGCRLTARDIDEQNYIVAQLTRLFDKTIVVDRREQPSHGYRAVHVIVDSDGKLIEIQVRTQLQHLRAELSEKLSDVVDNSIKYGGGDEDVQFLLPVMSDNIRQLEISETQLRQAPSSGSGQTDTAQQQAQAEKIVAIRKSTVELLERIGEVIPRVKGRRDDFSH
jgi:ppGpp synthetase/RelA/SpoT-type nucleotidyltranferase